MSTTSTTVQETHKVLAKAEHSEDSTLEVDDLIERIHVIPTFTDKHVERKWAKEQMAGAFRVLAKMGHNDGAGGHISLRDPVLRDCFWISKSPPSRVERRPDGREQTQT
jgi:hypothetical protein